MRSLLSASDDCIKVIDLDGNLSFMSEGGRRTMEVTDFSKVQGCPWPGLWPEAGRSEPQTGITEALAGRSYRFQGLADTAAGNSRYWDVQIAPIFGPDGKVESILSVSRDITALKAIEERQSLLALELKHRMKNTIALIIAIANQTLKGSPEIAAVKATFSARLETLSAAQDLLTQAAWSKATVGDLIQAALAPHGDASRFEIKGPEVEFSSKCALAMALATHELATNAVKYGSLRHNNGRIFVTWWVHEGTFQLHWQEVDGPPVVPPTKTGFGSRMIEKALAGYFGGSAKIDYLPHGVVFTLEAPIEALTAE